MAAIPEIFDKFMIAEYAAEVMVYLEKHKILEIVTRLLAEISLVRPDTKDGIRIWMGMNIKRIANDIYSNCLQIGYNITNQTSFYQLPGGYFYRIVMFGRRGSGRKTVARNLVKRFQLVYIDVEQLISMKLLGPESEQTRQLHDAFESGNANIRSKAIAEIIRRRLLQEDTLRHGWVIVNYPNNLMELRNIFEQFKIPPNKFVYLKCDSKTALRRLVSMPNTDRPQAKWNYIEQENRYFNEHEAEMKHYLSRRFETIFVDSKPTSNIVQMELLAKLERTPYLIGFKELH